jgi:hypothetical protein
MSVSEKASAPAMALPEEPEPVAVEEVSRSPIVFISEQEVVLATAAAMPLPPIPTRRHIEAARFIAAVVRRFARTMADCRPARRTYPPRCVYLERALMAREMDRL